ncbi:MAG: SMC-Scp complex subunit ScpB [Endomicrobiales bacterium]|nr:SMC-Scp complex subunit ScpB [Endomicrobiales bacterium]
MEKNDVKKIIEALLFVADQSLPLVAMKDALGEAAQGHDLETLVQELSENLKERNSPVEIRFVAGGWQLCTRREYSPWVRRLYREKSTLKLSPSAVETLAIIAYKQPITRSEVEEIRGVEASGVLETLLERKLIKIAGRKETLGRPLLYGTTQEFLAHFGLANLSELPVIEELAPQEEPAEELGPQEEALEAETQQKLELE